MLAELILTKGAVKPLNRPVILSSRTIVVIVLNVERYLIAVSGFCSRTLTECVDACK